METIECNTVASLAFTGAEVSDFAMGGVSTGVSRLVEMDYRLATALMCADGTGAAICQPVKTQAPWTTTSTVFANHDQRPKEFVF